MNDEQKIGAVVLAAGASRRMGEPKQVLRYRGQSLLRHAAETAAASRCWSVIIVLGAHAERLRAELSEPFVQGTVRAIENKAWAEGIGSSIAVGVEALIAAEKETEALVIMLCDQPLVSSQFINRLIDTYHRTGKSIVAAEYKETVGVPALFHRRHFAELLALRGDCGAKQVIAKHNDDVERMSFAEGAFDVDTPQEYEQLQAATITDSI